MSDERTYGFNKDDAGALIQSISNGEDWFPEIKPRGGGGHRITHGIVTEHLGCGRYLIEKAIWNGDPDTDGLGLGSGSGLNDCNPCFDVTGEGTSACAITLTIPPLQVTGTGVYVTAHDYASTLIPLVVGTGCLIVNLGDRDNAASGSASGSGAGTAIRQVLRGFHEHVVEYKEEWDCCEPGGPETLISKTPVILIGKECAPIRCGECPASGS